MNEAYVFFASKSLAIICNYSVLFQKVTCKLHDIYFIKLHNLVTWSVHLHTVASIP